jgi:hypothetical protein
MAQLDKADLEQMTDDYLQSLESESLVAVAKNLRALAVEQLEELEESSKTSSRPPSSDSPYQSTPVTVPQPTFKLRRGAPVEPMVSHPWLTDKS